MNMDKNHLTHDVRCSIASRIERRRRKKQFSGNVSIRACNSGRRLVNNTREAVVERPGFYLMCQLTRGVVSQSLRDVRRDGNNNKVGTISVIIPSFRV